MQHLTEATKKSLDEELFEFNSLNHEIALRRLEIQTAKEHDENIGGGRSSMISRLPETLTVKFSEDSRLQYLEDLRQNVENCRQRLTTEQQRIFDLRWIDNEANTWEEIAGKIHCSIKSIYRKREKILEAYAKEKGKM